MLDNGVEMLVAGEDAALGAGQGHGVVAVALQRHGQQGGGHVLAGTEQLVQLAHRRVPGQVAGQGHQSVGRAAHGGRDHDDVLAAALAFNDLPGDLVDVLLGR